MSPASRATTVVALGCAVSGHVSGQDVDVLGRFEGELDLSGRLHLADRSAVKARVRAELVEIEGEFEGEVRAGTLRVGEHARARGIFFAELLTVREGACLEGDVNPAESGVPPPPPASAVDGQAPEDVS